MFKELKEILIFKIKEKYDDNYITNRSFQLRNTNF